jgi:hypothetical protein
MIIANNTINIIIMMRLEMFKKVTKLLGAIALTGWVGVANATLIFDFSWEQSGKENKGEIRFIGNSLYAQPATNIILTKLSDEDVYYDFVNMNSFNVSTNLFSVEDNMIVSGSFFADFTNPLAFVGPRVIFEGYFYIFDISSPNSLRFDTYIFDMNNGFPIGADGSATVVFREVTVPEPATVILLSLGLAGLSFARYRRQS